MPTVIEEYILKQDKEIIPKLNLVYRTIKEVAFLASEKIAYQMPTFYINNNLVHFAAMKNHIGFYPSPSAILAFADELKDYKTSKGAIQFPNDKDIPCELIKRIVQFRIKEDKKKLSLNNYLKNPCGSLPLPYYKYKEYENPNIDTFRYLGEFCKERYIKIDTFFRIIHYLKNIAEDNKNVLVIDSSSDLKELVSLINLCYSSQSICVEKEDLLILINSPQYFKGGWLKIIIDGKIIGIIITTIDKEAKEGYIEWICVHPLYQRQGYGSILVNQAIRALAKQANFVTVSFNMSNHSPRKLYKKCGFEGDDFWYICYK